MTLQELLHARVGSDPRSHIAVVETAAGRVRILFGAVGSNPRVILGVEGNHVRILHPTDMPQDEPDVTAKPIGGGPVQFELAGGQTVELRDGVFFDGDTALYLTTEPPEEADPEPAPTTEQATATGTANDTTEPAGSDNGGSGDNPPPPPEAIDPKAHNRDALIKIALDEQAEHAPDATKAQIADAINAKRGVAAA